MNDQEIADAVASQFSTAINTILTANKVDLENSLNEITIHISDRTDILNKNYEKYTDRVKSYNKELDDRHQKQWELAESNNQKRHEDLKVHITQNNRLIAMSILLNTAGNVNIAKSYLDQIEKVVQ